MEIKGYVKQNMETRTPGVLEKGHINFFSSFNEEPLMNIMSVLSRESTNIYHAARDIEDSQKTSLEMAEKLQPISIFTVDDEGCGIMFMREDFLQQELEKEKSEVAATVQG